MEKPIKKQPLYEQLVDLLKEKIENELEPNSMLPSERELSEQYGLSRTTVRLALQELERMGYIYRQHGKGTFVSKLSEQATDLAVCYSFTDQMREMGKVPRTEILDFKVIEANKYLAKHMNVYIGDKLFELRRLRLADEMPMMVENSYLPFRKFMPLTLEELQKKPLYEVFSADFEEIIKLIEEEFSASIASEKDARLLEVPKSAPVLNLVRTTYNDKNEIIEFTLSVARADQFRYKVVHEGN
ncbi:MAG: GntR family transcriptional regulator [Eubacteriaceae bacterium]